MMDRATFNVIHLGLAFFCLMFAYQCHGHIVLSVISSVRNSTNGVSLDKNAGFYSSSIIFGTYTLGNFIAAPCVDFLGAKWALSLAAVIYTIFVAGFLHLNEIFYYASSGCVGFGAALLWTAQGVYLTQNSTPKTSKRNSGMLFAILDANVILIGVFLYFTFSIEGVGHGSDNHISKKSAQMLYIVLTSMGGLGILTFLFLRPCDVVKKQEENFGKIFCDTLRLFLDREMLLLALPFAWTGFQSSYYSGLFSTCVANTSKLGSNNEVMLAYAVLNVGAGIFVAGVLFMTPLSKSLSRTQGIFIGSIATFFAYMALYANLPTEVNQRRSDADGFLMSPNAWLILASGALLSFGGTCWNIQIFSFLVERFAASSSKAWAVFKFYQAMGSSLFFFYAPHIGIQAHMILLFVYLFLALCLFIWLERHIKKQDSLNAKMSVITKTTLA
ncbi:unnamed protein product, partial [Mesorhabditis spiculigera]